MTLTDGSTFKLSDDVGGNLNLLGNFSDVSTSASPFNANGRTVLFQGGNTTQTISKASGTESFFDVFVSETAGGEMKLLSPLTINGQLNLSTADSLLELNAKTLTLNGTVTGSGNLKGDGAATLSVTGTGALGTLNFLSGARTLSVFTVARTTSGSVTLGNELLVDVAMNLTSGIVNMGTFTLTLNGNVTRGSGYIIGNEQRFFSCSTSCSPTFDVGTANGYSPVSEVIHIAGLPGTYNQTIKATEGQHPSIHSVSANALQRYWAINKPAGADTAPTADITFKYRGSASPAGDVVGTEPNYKIFRYNGSFTQPPNQSIDTGAHTATVTGVSSFSDWTLAEAAAVMPGTLAFVGEPYSTLEDNNIDHDVTITVGRSGGTDGAIDLSYATSDGTATIADNDYVATSNVLHWNDGETGNKTFLVMVKGDLAYEANETVKITLSNPMGGATIGGANPTTLTITNDDGPAANATFTVNTTDDVDNGACVVSHCSLREAINAANALPDTNTITFSIPGGDPGCPSGICTINLTGVLPDLSTDMTITGAGANVLKIRRNTGGDYRIFTINSGKIVDISGLTITNGHVTSASSNNFGGGVYNSGTLSLTECAVSSNSATGGNGNFGGGIWNEVGHALTLTRSTVSGNSISGGSGNRDGGGVYNRGTLTIVNSTISGNTAASGAIGGGLGTDTGSVTIVNATVANNTAGAGGGLAIFSGGLNLKNTIVGDNIGTSSDPDIHGSFTSNGFNLIENTSGASFTPQATDITGVDANLGALGNNGGSTQTQALGTNSPALDKGGAATDPNTSAAIDRTPRAATAATSALMRINRLLVPPSRLVRTVRCRTARRPSLTVKL